MTRPPFFRTLYSSATSPRFYETVLRSPSSHAWSYFLRFHLLIAVTIAVIATAFLAAFDPRMVTQGIRDIYPQDLEVTFDEEKGVAINQDLPYAIPIPDSLHDIQEEIENAEENARTINNLIVFVGEGEGAASMEEFLSYESVIVAEPKQASVMDENGTLRIVPLTGEADAITNGSGSTFTLTREKIDGAFERFHAHSFIAYRLYVIPFFLLAVLLVWGGFMLFALAQLLIFTFVTWLLSLLFLRDRRLTYGTLYLVGVHSRTLPVLLELLLPLIGLTFFHGWVFFFAYLAWTMYVLSESGTTLSSSAAIEASSAPKTKKKKRVEK